MDQVEEEKIGEEEEVLAAILFLQPQELRKL